MHGIGEIHRGRAGRQFQDRALGREHVDFVREQVGLDVLDEFQRVAGMLLHLQQVLHPLSGADVALVRGVVG